MTSVAISQLKANPSKIILEASDLPVAIKKRSDIQAYLIGKELYEKIIALIEDHIDTTAVKKTNFTEGRDFEEVAQELGI